MEGQTFEHVGAQGLGPPGAEVVGVVLHERDPARPPRRHHLERPQQHRCLPVALGAKAVALCHQALHGYPGQLAEPPQVLEVGGEGAKAPAL